MVSESGKNIIPLSSLARGDRKPSPRRSSKSDGARLAQLSDRQKQIMDLLATGLGNKDIAQRLGLTDGTIKQHLAAIFRKLGVTNRTWAADLWRNHQKTPQASEHARPDFSSATHHVAQTAEPVRAHPQRLVAAVALGFQAKDFAGDVTAQALAQSQLRQLGHYWARIWGGRITHNPTGFLLATFGYAPAHMDDVERADMFLNSLSDALTRHVMHRPCAALVADVEPLFISNDILVDSQVVRQALHLAMQAKPGQVHRQLPEVNIAYAIQSGYPGLPSLVNHAPFLAQARDALARTQAFWLSVEAWPPINGKYLLDCLTQADLGRGSATLALRMPDKDAAQDSEAISAILAAQVQAQAHLPELDAQASNDLSWWLEVLALRSPLRVLVYGSRNLQSFRHILRPEFIERLHQLPIFFAFSALPLQGVARLAVRPLGVRGERPLIGRIHEMALPEALPVMAATYPDLYALLDNVSDVEHEVLRLLAQYNVATPQFLARSFNLTIPDIDSRILNLIETGLILRDSDGRMSIRDDLTLSAIKQIYEIA